jgi:hypothetical protein
MQGFLRSERLKGPTAAPDTVSEAEIDNPDIAPTPYEGSPYRLCVFQLTEAEGMGMHWTEAESIQ